MYWKKPLQIQNVRCFSNLHKLTAHHCNLKSFCAYTLEIYTASAGPGGIYSNSLY